MRVARIVIALSWAVTAIALSACGNTAGSGSRTSATVATAESAPDMRGSAVLAQFGSGCSAVPTSGRGSFQGMAGDPVATAASHNPVLSTFYSAIQKANLVDTLNNAQNLTVFAPANAAFQQLPQVTLDRILADSAKLDKTLTYHVVGRRIGPAELAPGNFNSLEGATVSTSGSGQEFTINGNSRVVCGNVQTANATVYIVDSLLIPPGM
jgi:uncharacterized surface protein with fasciclin (FAS1) repeats